MACLQPKKRLSAQQIVVFTELIFISWLVHTLWVPNAVLPGLLIFEARLLLRMNVKNYTSSTDFFVHVQMYLATTSESSHLVAYKAHCIHTQHSYM